MITDSDLNGPLPQRWLAVLEAVAELCLVERTDSVPTDLVSRRMRAIKGSGPARTALRGLRRQGYLYAAAESVEGAPRQWGLTAAGRSLTRGGSDSTSVPVRRAPTVRLHENWTPAPAGGFTTRASRGPKRFRGGETARR